MKLKKKTKIRILISVFIILIFSLVYNNYLSSEAYIKSVTGIKLPFWTVTNETSMMEIAVIGKFQIPESKVEEFISENNLNKLTTDSDIGIGLDYLLKKKNRLQNKKGEWFQYKNCESGNVWKILFNSDSRDLWILVQYPDMAGDEPPCN
ncbi:hypothetical protein SCB49_13635 [unidentified eubacterium SCB49]|nr:hypothetical protein SCB49_13635 [unidentified eubacterium SCB49]